ncbi:MAG: hypothetical protein LBT66_05810 [Methanobrevibacter sp.]|jgi:hypothetical protein|nr:hypothetical protein [Candidatus Methanovirga meridionalis]
MKKNNLDISSLERKKAININEGLGKKFEELIEFDKDFLNNDKLVTPTNKSKISSIRVVEFLIEFYINNLNNEQIKNNLNNEDIIENLSNKILNQNKIIEDLKEEIKQKNNKLDNNIKVPKIKKDHEVDFSFKIKQAIIDQLEQIKFDTEDYLNELEELESDEKELKLNNIIEKFTNIYSILNLDDDEIFIILNEFKMNLKNYNLNFINKNKYIEEIENLNLELEQFKNENKEDVINSLDIIINTNLLLLDYAVHKKIFLINPLEKLSETINYSIAKEIKKNFDIILINKQFKNKFVNFNNPNISIEDLEKKLNISTIMIDYLINKKIFSNLKYDFNKETNSFQLIQDIIKKYDVELINK